tara:strand:+ start:3262 stop:3450 length:189 start_codon:yes stop_codon:yes gene_type:complete
METINLNLPNGTNLEVQVTPEFISKIQDHFNIDSPENVSEDHIRMFIYGSVKSAVEKAEQNR